MSPLTWDGHNSDSQKSGRARDHVKDGEAGVGSSSSGEEIAEQIHKRHNGPAVEQQ